MKKVKFNEKRKKIEKGKFGGKKPTVLQYRYMILNVIVLLQDFQLL